MAVAARLPRNKSRREERTERGLFGLGKFERLIRKNTLRNGARGGISLSRVCFSRRRREIDRLLYLFSENFRRVFLTSAIIMMMLRSVYWKIFIERFPFVVYENLTDVRFDRFRIICSQMSDKNIWFYRFSINV